MPADAAADEAPRHDAEPLGIEVAQIDDVHAGKIARPAATRMGPQ